MMDSERGRLSLAFGRDSDIRLGTLPADDTENTFVFTVPPKDMPNPQNSDSSPDSPVPENNENDDWEEVDRLEADDPASDNHPDGSIGILESSLHDVDTSAIVEPKLSRKKKIRISKYGIQYPSLPVGVVKKLATQYARTSGSKAKISKETLDAIIQASDWFFEQVSDDLGAYSKHASRKTIDDSDIITLMKRYVLLMRLVIL
jgi:histone H3/H4